MTTSTRVNVGRAMDEQDARLARIAAVKARVAGDGWVLTDVGELVREPSMLKCGSSPRLREVQPR